MTPTKERQPISRQAYAQAVDLLLAEVGMADSLEVSQTMSSTVDQLAWLIGLA